MGGIEKENEKTHNDSDEPKKATYHGWAVI